MLDTIYRVKKLPERISKKGRVFKLLNRGEKVAIFQVLDEGIFMGYEVIKIGLKSASETIRNIEWLNKKKYMGDLINFDKIEVYPSVENRKYSSWFFSHEDMGDAFKKFHEMNGENNESV